MGNAARKELHELVDTLPDSAVREVREYIKERFEVDDEDAYAYLDQGDPHDNMSEEELARLDATIDRSLEDARQGRTRPAQDLIDELRRRRG